MESGARLALPPRPLALLLVVFLVPFGVLAALAIRTVNQDRELAVRRDEDDRRRLTAAVRQEFLGRLERLKLRALSAPRARLRTIGARRAKEDFACA